MEATAPSAATAGRQRTLAFAALAVIALMLIALAKLSLLIWVAGGLALGLAFRFFWRRPDRLWILFPIAGFAMLLALAGGCAWLFLNVTPYSDAPDPPALESVSYTGTATYTRDKRAWQIEDVIAIGPDSLRRIAAARSADGQRDGGAHPRRTLRELSAVLAEDGWKPRPRKDGKTRFAMVRSVPATVERWPLQSTDAIALPTMALGQPYLAIELVTDEASTVTLIAPRYTIKDTYPAAESRENLLDAGDQEAIVLPARVEEVRAQVISTALRSELGTAIADVSYSKVLKWAILGLCALFSGWIKKNILEPLVDLLLRRLRVPRVAPATAGDAPQSPLASRGTRKRRRHR